MQVSTRVTHSIYLVGTVLSFFGILITIFTFCYYTAVTQKNSLKSLASMYSTTINSMVHLGLSDSTIQTVMRNTRFDNNLDGYFFLIEKDTQNIFHPLNDRLSSTKATLAKDSLGNSLYQSILHTLSTKSDPFLTYYWRGIERGAVEKKLAYILETDNNWILVATQYDTRSTFIVRSMAILIGLWLSTVIGGIFWLRRLLLPIQNKITRLKTNITKVLSTASGVTEVQADDELDYVCNLFGVFMATIMRTYGNAVSSTKQVKHNCETLKMVALELKRMSLTPDTAEHIKYIDQFEDKLNQVYTTTNFIGSQLARALKTANKYVEGNTGVFDTPEGRLVKDSLQAIQQSISTTLESSKIPDRTQITIYTADTEINADDVEMTVLSQDAAVLHYLMKALSVEVTSKDGKGTKSVDQDALLNLYSTTLDELLRVVTILHKDLNNLGIRYHNLGDVMERHRSTVPGLILTQWQELSKERDRIEKELKELAGIKNSLTFLDLP